MRFLLVGFLVLSAACRSFELPDAADSTSVTVEPPSAFAGQAVRLGFAGALPDLENTYVAIGGRVARRLDEGRDFVVVEVPRVEGCAQELPVEVGALPGAAAVLGYLGAGHPGNPRPRLVREVPVGFEPLELEALTGGLVAAGRGSLVLSYSSENSFWLPLHADDYVAAIQGVGGCDGIAYMGRHGGFGTVSALELLRPEVPAAGANVPDLETSLLSAFYDGPASLVAEAAECNVTPRVRGLALGSSKAPPIELALDGEGAFKVAEAPGHPLALFLDGEQGRVVPLASGYLALRGGALPAAQQGALLEAQDEFPLSRELSMGGSLTPVAARAASVAGAGSVVAAAWRYEGTADQTGPVPGGQGSGSGSEDDFGVSPSNHQLSVVFVPEAALPGSQIEDAWISVGDLLLRDVAIAVEGAQLSVFAVDGEQSVLWRFKGGLAPLTLELAEVLPLPEPGVKVLARGAADVVVADARGRIYELSGAPLQLRSSNRVRLGVAAIAARTPESCSDSPVLVGAAGLDSLVVVPTSAGRSPEFFEAPLGLSQVEAVQVPDSEGAARTFYVAASDAGLFVSEPIAQAHARGEGSDRTRRFDFFASALAVVPDEGGAHLVVGGLAGFGAVRLDGDFAPPDALSLPTPPACPGISQLVRLGTKVLALADWEGSSRLCVFDPATGEVSEGEPLPAGWEDLLLAGADEIATEADPSLRAPLGMLTGFAEDGWLFAAVEIDTGGAARVERLVLPGDFTSGLPARIALSAAALSPDGGRLFVGVRGDHPGLFAIDPLCLRALAAASAAGDAAGTTRRVDACLATMTTIALSAAPVGFSLSVDGARVIAALEDDSLAIVE